jgi:hypothetical protein
VRLFCFCVVLCAGSDLATDLSPVQGVLPTVYRLRYGKIGQSSQELYKAIDKLNLSDKKMHISPQRQIKIKIILEVLI